MTIKLIITGALAGCANGFFGSGGGLFLVPLFIKWIKLEVKTSFATSIAVIFPLSAISLIVYLFKGDVDFMFALPFLVGGFFGGIISGRIFGKIPIFWLRRGFGVLLIYSGIRGLFLL